MKKILVIVTLFLCAAIAHAETAPETWSVDGKTFETKSAAIRYVMNSGKRLNVTHARCEILTNKLSFKACPKNKKSAFDNEQFESLSKHE